MSGNIGTYKYVSPFILEASKRAEDRVKQLKYKSQRSFVSNPSISNNHSNVNKTNIATKSSFNDIANSKPFENLHANGIPSSRGSPEAISNVGSGMNLQPQRLPKYYEEQKDAYSSRSRSVSPNITNIAIPRNPSPPGQPKRNLSPTIFTKPITSTRNMSPSPTSVAVLKTTPIAARHPQSNPSVFAIGQSSKSKLTKRLVSRSTSPLQSAYGNSASAGINKNHLPTVSEISTMTSIDEKLPKTKKNSRSTSPFDPRVIDYLMNCSLVSYLDHGMPSPKNINGNIAIETVPLHTHEESEFLFKSDPIHIYPKFQSIVNTENPNLNDGLIVTDTKVVSDGNDNQEKTKIDINSQLQEQMLLDIILEKLKEMEQTENEIQAFLDQDLTIPSPPMKKENETTPNANVEKDLDSKRKESSSALKALQPLSAKKRQSFDEFLLDLRRTKSLKEIPFSLKKINIADLRQNITEEVIDDLFLEINDELEGFFDEYANHVTNKI